MQIHVTRIPTAKMGEFVRSQMMSTHIDIVDARKDTLDFTVVATVLWIVETVVTVATKKLRSLQDNTNNIEIQVTIFANVLDYLMAQPVRYHM